MSSLYSLTGAAAFRAARPARDGVVEFSGGRTVAMPMAAAIPVLSKAHRREDLHPSVSLLSGAVMLGLRLVAAGRIEPGDGPEPGWRAVIEGDDEDRVVMLARSRAYAEVDEGAAEQTIRSVLDAVADAVPRAAPPRRRTAAARPRPPDARQERDASAFQDRLRDRLARHVTAPSGGASAGEGSELPQLVSISLRVEADEEELVGGSIRLVAQAHDDRDPLHVADVGRLWRETSAEHGFGERARTHALVALRGAAEAWPVLDRLLDLPVPDQMTLDADELDSLLEDGVAALRSRGIDVLWPRSLTPELTARVVLDRTGGKHEDLMQDSPFSAEQTCAFRWQLALDGDALTDAEMETLAAAAAPLLKLRGSWTVVHPSLIRKARKRLLRKVSATEALATALTGTLPEKVAEQVADAASDPGGQAEGVVVGASIGRLRDRVSAVLEAPPVALPPRLDATLRGYQHQGLTWLAGITGLGLGGCLADDMGLGKTITLIALHLHRVSTGASDGRPTLVVCPASLLGNWEAEIARFAPGVPVRRFHGSGRDLDSLEVLDHPDRGFVLTTYGTMRRDAEALAAVGWDLVVADEAQHLKNAASATAKAIRTIASRARVALTGTPVENDLTELWAIVDWCVPGLLGSRLAFRRAWASQIEAGVDQRMTRRFAALIAPFLLRRRKSDPGIAPELPPKTETDHPLALTREQAVLYESFVRDSMERIERADPISRRGLVLMLLTGLKQICNHPAQFLKQQSGRMAGRSQKIDLLDELLETVLAEDGAVLVFTQYVAMARLLEAHWETTGVPHQFLHGGTPVRERERMVARFQAGEVPVFLLSLQAGGVGLNLTRADHVVHVDRWWNPAVEDQATDRAHRIGQTQPVQVHRLITRGTVEEKVAELLTRKRALAAAVLGSGEAALTELSDAELRDLVSLR